MHIYSVSCFVLWVRRGIITNPMFIRLNICFWESYETTLLPRSSSKLWDGVVMSFVNVKLTSRDSSYACLLPTCSIEQKVPDRSNLFCQIIWPYGSSLVKKCLRACAKCAGSHFPALYIFRLENIFFDRIVFKYATFSFAESYMQTEN